MPVPIKCYRASPYFRWAGFVALAIAGFSVWIALGWAYAWIAVGLALASAAVDFILGFAPRIAIYESHLKMGDRLIPWAQIRRLDRIVSMPLLVRATLADRRRVFMIHAGDFESSHSLLRHLRRFSREALIDGVPHLQFWGSAAGSEPKQLPPPHYPLLIPEDEAEVERLFQQLKTVGHLDQKGSRPKSSSSQSSSPSSSNPSSSGDES